MSFGTLSPGLPDWRDAEAEATLAAINAAKPAPARSWYDTINDVAHFPHRMFGALATAPANTIRAVGSAIWSGLTAPGDAATGKLPMWGPDGHTSPEAVQRAFDTASLPTGASVAGTVEGAAARAPQAVSEIAQPYHALLSDTGKPGAVIAAAEHAPTFRSTVEDALAATPRKSATGQQWANDLKRFGAKPEELDWRGASDLFTANANKPLSRAAVEEHLAGNKVDLKPVDLVTPSWENLTGKQQEWVHEAWRDSRYPGNFDNAKEFFDDVVASSPDEFSRLLPNRAKWGDYQSPGGENYRERLLTLNNDPLSLDRVQQWHDLSPEMWARTNARDRIELRDEMAKHLGIDPSASQAFHGNHWDQPNVVVHRRSNERMMDVPPTAEEQAALDAHAAAQSQIEKLRQRQGAVGKEIMQAARPLEDQYFRNLYDEIDAKKLGPGDARRMIEAPLPEFAELKPLQDKLQALRSQEDDLRKSLPPKPEPKQIKTLHAEEIQSDWHQAGAKNGYKEAGWQERFDSAKSAANSKAENLVASVGGDYRLADRLEKAVREGDAATVNLYTPQQQEIARDAVQHIDAFKKMNEPMVPNGPFKDSWHRLALHDMVREAAEKGFDRISWTAGDSQATHPKNLGASQRAIESAEKGMRAFYDDKLVNAANKIGKPHGVSVQKGTIADRGGLSGEMAMNRMGIPPHEQEAFWGNLNAQGAQAREQFLQQARDRGHDIWHMDIPQSLKEQALKKGFSMFEDSGKAGAALAAAERVQAPPIAKTKLVDERGLPIQGPAAMSRSEDR